MGKQILRNFIRLFLGVLISPTIVSISAQTTLHGTNAPGAATIFPASVNGGVSNLSLTVPGSASSFSHLLIKAGVAPTLSNYDFAAQTGGVTNSIHLEVPELTAANYQVGVFTPVESATHKFSLLIESNRADLRTVDRPVSKRLTGTNTGIFPAANSRQYFRFEVPSNSTGWKIALDSSHKFPDLYVQRGGVPTETVYLKRSVNLTNDVIAFSDVELVPGSYFVSVVAPAGSPADIDYALSTEAVNVIGLDWDAGTTHEGTSVFTNQEVSGGDFYFKIRTASPALGAWRTALKVISGEADFYLSKGTLPSPASFNFKSDKPGSDGLVLAASQFNAGEDWYIMVRATAGAQWSLVSGAPFVSNLGDLSAGASSGSGEVEIGPEGFRFFQTTVPSDALAWRLGLGGLTNVIYLKKTGVPLPVGNELNQAGQMLVVPPYLAGGQTYFIGVAGSPGSRINLDSRQQPISDITFASSTNVTVTGYGYATYRVQVPPEQIAWQISVIPSAGNPNVSVRRNLVANEWNNDAYSEVAGSVTDSISLVPPVLSDGTFYITVYNTNTTELTNSFTLHNGTPVVTDIHYISSTTNDDTNRVGWRYYRVADISQQLGSLGWDLFLNNFSPGTKIALRRNAVPSIWNSRNGTASSILSAHHNFLGTDFLQRPGHQADVWYIGVYNPTNVLGEFTLITRELGTEILAGDGGSSSRSNVVSGKWEFFRVEIPEDILGWDIRLTNVVSGSPKIVVRREGLPVSLTSTLSSPATATNWAGGAQWAATVDWTKRANSSDGKNEEGRILAMGMGRPLQPGIYYVGVINSTGTNEMSYSVSSRFIGDGKSIPVHDLNCAGGIVTNLSLAPREAAYYRVNVPANSPSWKVRLSPNVGELMLVVSSNGIPNLMSEKRVQKSDREHYVRLPDQGQSFLNPGIYYLAVVGEGEAPVSTTQVGGGTTSYVLESLGAMPEIDLGTLDDELFIADTLEGGESKAYHFATIPGQLGFEIILEDRVGNPTAVSSGTLALTDPGLASSPAISADLYGNEGGEKFGVASTHIINVADPFPLETIMVKARGSGGNYPDASYTLKVRKFVPEPLSFNAGTYVVTNQSPGSWRFFRVEVPSNASGWDIRVTNVLSGDPKIVVGRDYLPISLTTSPGFNPAATTNFPSGARWAAGKDWTGRSMSADGAQNEDGRILAMGMGRPLQPGTYYVGVQSGSDAETLNYTLVSRGIGTGMTIPIQEIEFAGGTVTVSNLLPREAAFYRVEVPSNAPSWKVTLKGLESEVALVALKDAIPNILAATALSSTNATSAGKKMQKLGDEHFFLSPSVGQTNLAPGSYYLAVISEGKDPTHSSRIGSGASGFVLTSDGPMPFLDLGAISPLSDLVATGMVHGGESIAYQFTVPAGTLSLEARLENREGNPTMSMRAAPLLPNSGMAGTGVTVDSYGNEGGETVGTDISASFINAANPVPGTYYIIIKSRVLTGLYPDSAFTLRLNAIGAAGVIFDNGSLAITNQASGSWRYFRVEVPTNVLGWDVRLVDVSAGLPKLVVRRDALPNSLTAPSWSSPGNQLSWPSSNQWAAAGDWTKRTTSNDGATNEDGRILAMGLGRPLEPGTYYVGVTSASNSTNTMSYTFLSRGIGHGFAIPVVDLPFQGSATNFALAPRDAAYYRVVVPSNTPSWKVKLSVTGGEAMLAGLSNFVPNVTSIQVGSTLSNGKGMQKAGNEHFVQLPVNGQTNIPAGTNYFVVVGEGINPPATTRIGSGVSSYVIRSQGALPVMDLGVVTSSDLEHTDDLEGGEVKAYQFTVPPGSLGVEVRLENRVGNPVMVLRQGTSLPDPGGASSPISAETYGNQGGYPVVIANATLLTIPNPEAGVYSLLVKGRALGSVVSDASYRLRVKEILLPELNFGSADLGNGLTNSASGLLENNQRAYFRFEVPTNFNGKPILGWKLILGQSSGLATMRVRKDLLPSDTVSGMPFTSASAIIAPPFLTNGTWYVEVKGSNTTAFTLTSNPLELERPAWVMPSPEETNSPPGLTLPIFGDTGMDTNGVSIGGDESLFLEQGNFHYYGILVSTQNVGLLRAQLEAISGNPDLYLRVGDVPTLQHNAVGNSGTMFDRSMLATTTEYANWVPFDGKTEMQLKPGFWYLAVRAAGNANARYRLRISLGDIQNIPLSGVTLSSQILAGGDWRYYRVQMPMSVPIDWNISFTQESGDVFMYLRDTVPPGNGDSGTQFKDWKTDAKNNDAYPSFDPPGTYSFKAPPLRPGHTYYIGFRALNDATFSMAAWTNGTVAMNFPIVDFYGGHVVTNIAGQSQMTYRIDVPADATRFKLSSVHATNLQIYIEQGTLPQKATTDDFRSTGADSVVNRYLLNSWTASNPWQPGQSYFLTVTNTSDTGASFSFTMDGKNALTDDNDNDLLPDAWELQYFGVLSQSASGDWDKDGISNLLEFQEGTDPSDKFSYRPRLITTSMNGIIERSLNAPHYAMNSFITLTAIPNPGYAFVNWSGAANGSENPLSVLMDTNRSISAVFKVIGDEFSTRVPIIGTALTGQGTNVGATKEPGESNHANNSGGKSIWWTWTAPLSGAAVISTAGSTFNTLLAVYTGQSVSNLTLIASDINSLGGTNRSRVTFDAVAGTEYQIAVDGFNGGSGTVHLSLATSGWSKIASYSISGQALQFTLEGESEAVYFLEGSTNLVDWVVVRSITNGSTGTLNISVPVDESGSQFFRLRAP